MTDEPVPNPGGRPLAEIDLDVVRNSAAIGCTVEEIASVLGLGRSTVYKYMELNPAVQEAIDEGRAKGRATLRRIQWQRANGGSDTMCIWLGKQMLGQKDRSDVTTDDKPVTGIVVSFVAPRTT